MSWVLLAIISAATIAIISVLDKAFLHYYSRSHWTLLLLIGVAQTLIGFVIVVSTYGSEIPWSGVQWSIVSGTLWALNTVLVIRVLSKTEVSRTIPVVLSFPIFVAPMAVIVLGEELSTTHWVSIGVAVIGSVIISTKFNDRLTRPTLDTSLCLLLFASVLLAGSHIAIKLSLEELTVLPAHGWRALSFGIVLLVIATRSEAISDVVAMVRQKSFGLGIFGVNEFIVANIGMLLNLLALSLGPVSLVSAITASSSLFVFLYGSILGIRFRGFLGEQVNWQTLVMKGISTVMIVGAVVAIAIS
mgnify:CR=1 FL=1